MRYFLTALLIVLAVPVMLFSEAPKAPPAVKIAVLGIISRATNSSIDVNTLTELLQKNLSEKKPFLIVERTALSNILAEYRLDLTGLTENDKAPIASIKEADKLVVGSVSQVGSKYLLIVKVLDVRSGVMDMSVTAESRTSDGLFELVASLADRIAKRAQGDLSSTNKNPVIIKSDTGTGAIPGLLSYFPFNKNARDAGPSKNDGIVQGAVMTNDRWGAPRSAYAIPADFGMISLSSRTNAPAEFTINIWFVTDSRNGGRIVGFGDSQFRDGSVSELKDRHIMMHESGRVSFGMLTAGTNQVLITTKNTYNDGSWHCATAVFSGTDGMALYLDGELEARTNAFPPLVYEGNWRVGYDQLSDWAYQPRLFTLYGIFDDLRIYQSALTPAQIMDLYREGNWEGE